MAIIILFIYYSDYFLLFLFLALYKENAALTIIEELDTWYFP